MFFAPFSVHNSHRMNPEVVSLILHLKGQVAQFFLQLFGLSVIMAQNIMPVIHPQQRHFNDITGQVDGISAAVSKVQISEGLMPHSPADVLGARIPDRLFFVMGRYQLMPRGWEPLDLLGLNKARAPYNGPK